jgi:hypothetical protein
VRQISLIFGISTAVVAVAWTQPSPTPSHIVSRILRQPVESRALAKIGYSKRHHILEIEFLNGAVYRYLERAGHGVPRPDGGGIKGALLRFEHQATLSLGSHAVPTNRASIREINRIDARNLRPFRIRA